ncbi:FAD synthase [Mycoplasma sp. VS509_3]|uniref:FAD synthase n=1 Tax=unclassified Mycoplasma TaxID=2683645 RepID=UPI003AB0C849
MDQLIVYELSEFSSLAGDNFILGSFESFHLGHYQLFKQAMANGGRVILVCFNAQKGMPKFNDLIFTDNYAKYEQLARLPLDAIVQLDFNEVKNYEGIEFLAKLAQGNYVTFIAGQDFRFGNKAAYTLSDFSVPDYEDLFRVQEIELMQDIGTKISTSTLKESLEFGDIDFINSLLVYDYSFSGVLKEDALETIPQLAKIHAGLYCALFHIKELVYYGILHVTKNGVRKVFLIGYQLNDSVQDTIVVSELKHKIRVAVSNFDDEITTDDIALAKDYFARNKK